MKKWKILGSGDDIFEILLTNRGLISDEDKEAFLHPPNPFMLTPKDVGIDARALKAAIARIRQAIASHESIVVYADYDADGITAGAIMWETIHALGGIVMPYIPHRAEEGYGLSMKGIDAVREQYDPSLIVTVDHGITAKDKVDYAKGKGIDVIVTDHHSLPKNLPDCTIVHTTKLCGAGVSWFVSKELSEKKDDELLALATIGTVADLVPLVGANRSIVKYGLTAINETKRVGLLALLFDAGVSQGSVDTYVISHMVAPRLNAMGRLVHAMDALRLLCTGKEDKAMMLARTLGLTNKERQQLTIDTSVHAKDIVVRRSKDRMPKLLFVSDSSYNQGVIGLVAGKLVEEYYRPAIVVSEGSDISKASARSIPGFNIVEAIRTASDLLIDVGGHPMAAGFTIATKNLDALSTRLTRLADKEISDEMLVRELRLDMELSLDYVTGALWKEMSDFEPFGFGSPEPSFAARAVTVVDARSVGADGKHMKLTVRQNKTQLSAIAFGMGEHLKRLKPDMTVNIAYTIDMNEWNGTRKLQLKIKDMQYL